MRSGVQQPLAADAAAVVRQAVSAARRRGHAQVTPLHVASAMLLAGGGGGGGGGILRAACLRSQSHPLQCKTLELCFNVALNRLATAGGGTRAAAPVLSNALAAAFKRAHANQRRGGGCCSAAEVQHQQQAKTVDLEQLAVSILDDPSVNRVMHEAGFSGAEVRASLENEKPVVVSSKQHSSNNAATSGGSASPPDPNPKIDVVVMDCMASGRKRAAGVVTAVIDRVTTAGERELQPPRHDLTYCDNSDVMATPTTTPASVEPFWFRRSQGPVLYGPDLTLSFPSPAAASSSIYGFPHYCDPNNLSDQRQLCLNRRQQHGGPMAESHDQPQRPAIPNHHPGSSNSASISSSGGVIVDAKATGHPLPRRPKFTELTAENLKTLSSALETSVPRDVATGIAGAVLRRRSGVTATRTTRRHSSAATWLLFRGRDSGGKAAVARELARLVFGSYDDFFTTALAASTESTNKAPAPSAVSSSDGRIELMGHKRRRLLEEEEKELGCVVLPRFHDAVLENPHRVFLIECSAVRWDDNGSEEEAGAIMSAIATGTVRGREGGDVASLEDAIVVLSCEVLEPWSTAPSSSRRLKPRSMSHEDIVVCTHEDDDDGIEKGGIWPRFSLDLNACAGGGELEEAKSSLLDGAETILNVIDGVFFFPSS